MYICIFTLPTADSWYRKQVLMLCYLPCEASESTMEKINNLLNLRNPVIYCQSPDRENNRL